MDANVIPAEERALVVLSGGQDSATCLHWALQRFAYVEAITFRYGQRHAVEIDCATKLAEQAGVPHTFASVESLGHFGAAALTSPQIDVAADATGTGNAHAEAAGLPSTFVPGRNLLFLGLAGAYATQHGLRNIVTGVCQQDEAGYPDCRASFIDAMQVALNEAMGLEDLTIHAPLLTIDKAATWRMAEDLGIVDTIVNDTHTCYEGVHDDDNLHLWGYGCGECPACKERERGYREAFIDTKETTNV